MRLLNVETYCLEEYFEPSVPPYAILSHRWEQEEVLYNDIGAETSRAKKGWAKVKLTCDQARKDHLAYVWIDTCCIDKKSSAELSEAINSMFRWYQNSSTCYVYLSDVTSPFMDNITAWFDRGWTLQELIAPQRVVFYNHSWSRLGDRTQLSYQLSRKTRIPSTVLCRVETIEKVLLHYTAAQKFSWAAGRKTTRIEDRAYSLLGLFGLNMPLLYGEGSQAFARLQEEILRTGTDLSILAWSQKDSQAQSSLGNLLAESPDNFDGCEDIISVFSSPYVPTDTTDIAMTNKGLQIDYPPIVTSQDGGSKIALSLGCRRSDDVLGILALKIWSPVSDNLVDPLQTSKRRVCRVGWPSDRQTQDTRVARAEFFEPSLQHDWQAITIPRHHVHQGSMSRPVFDNPHQYLWFILPDTDEVSWTVRNFWPRDNDTWDPETKACYLGSNTYPVKFASIKVESQHGESFAVILRYWFTKIHFHLPKFDTDSFPAVAEIGDEKYRDTEAWLDLSPQCRIRVARHDIRPAGYIVRQLKITVFRSAYGFRNEYEGS